MFYIFRLRSIGLILLLIMKQRLNQNNSAAKAQNENTEPSLRISSLVFWPIDTFKFTKTTYVFNPGSNRMMTGGQWRGACRQVARLAVPRPHIDHFLSPPPQPSPPAARVNRHLHHKHRSRISGTHLAKTRRHAYLGRSLSRKTR